MKQLNPNDFAVLVNALFFQAPWAYQFNDSLNFPRAFRVGDGMALEKFTMMERTFGRSTSGCYYGEKLDFGKQKLDIAILPVQLGFRA